MSTKCDNKQEKIGYWGDKPEAAISKVNDKGTNLNQLCLTIPR